MSEVESILTVYLKGKNEEFKPQFIHLISPITRKSILVVIINFSRKIDYSCKPVKKCPE